MEILSVFQNTDWVLSSFISLNRCGYAKVKKPQYFLYGNYLFAICFTLTENIKVNNHVYIYNNAAGISKKNLIFDTILQDSFSKTNWSALFGQHIFVYEVATVDIFPLFTIKTLMQIPTLPTRDSACYCAFLVSEERY